MQERKKDTYHTSAQSSGATMEIDYTRSYAEPRQVHALLSSPIDLCQSVERLLANPGCISRAQRILNPVNQINELSQKTIREVFFLTIVIYRSIAINILKEVLSIDEIDIIWTYKYRHQHLHSIQIEL